jgi:ElaB/YqjD/DUF883 family membrane-anchored ribosome-binding protein
MNPSEGDFAESDPAASMSSASDPAMENDGRLRRVAQRASNTAAETWQTTKERTGLAREKTEIFLRENPVPTIVGALLVGVAIGWALRYAVAEDEEEIAVPARLGRLGLGSLSMPFLWPFLKSVKEKYEDSAETVKEGLERGVDRLRDIDVKRYAKPLRKRWKDWTD